MARASLARRIAWRIEDTAYELRQRLTRPKRETSPSDTSSRSNLLGAAFGEYLGTLLFVLFGLLAAVHAAANGVIAGGALDSLSVPLAFGGALAVLILAIGPYTGANFNPAITFALWRHGGLDFRTAVVYWIAQLLGGVSAALLTRLLSFGFTGAASSGYGITVPSGGSPAPIAYAVELIGMAVFQFVIAAVVAKKWNPFLTGISIGLTLGVLILVFGPVSGGAFNPARALGPMVVTGNLVHAPGYVIAQLLGAWVGQWYYQRRLRKVDQPS